MPPIDQPHPRSPGRTSTASTWPALFRGLALAGCGAEEKGQAPPSPLAGSLAGRSVVLIVADALHAHHLGAHGYARPTSPTIDRLAEQGTLFTDASSQTSWTVSSVASLFTSLEQERHGLLYDNQHLGDEASTLAELFQASGYRTAALIQNGILWSRRDQDGWPGTRLCRGFDTYEMFPDMDRVVQETDRLMARAREVLLAPGEEPVFTYLHLLPPHEPYQPPAAFRGLFEGDYDGPVDGSPMSALQVATGQPGYDRPEDLAQLVALYDEHIAYMDRELRGLLTELQSAEREFLYIFTSDHGEAFGEHRNLGHNSQVQEEMVHVPLVIHAPGSSLPRGRVCTQPASLLDLLPTLVELCGLPGPRQAPSGLSLTPLLETPIRDNGEFAERPLFYTSRYKRKDPEQLNFALRRGAFKYMRFWKNEREALFNLDQDPGEQTDLGAAQPKLLRRLSEKLDASYRRAAEGGLEGGGEGDIPPDVLENMRKMGYTGE